MSGKAFLGKSKTTSALALCAFAFVAGCDENGEFAMPSFGASSAASGEAAAASPAVKLVERDVEAPDVFSVSENGLWDGRPSLGGIWVAHPDVKDPERVIIRNQANDEFVVGALFRRERENPGPALQVSSDAAEALGVLAGSPTLLSVVALRREEGPAEATIQAETEVLGPPPGVEATPLDGGTAVAEAPAAPEPPSDPVASAAEIAIAAAEAAGVGAVETAEAPAAPAPAPAPAPRPASTLDKPFIQIGFFSEQGNANRTADMLRTNGLVPTILNEEIRGRAFYRVIVGPAATTGDRAQVLQKAKSLGFNDAYFVAR